MKKRKGGKLWPIFAAAALLALALAYAAPGAPSHASEAARPQEAHMRDGLVAHFIDVGQGDATLIQTSGGNALIDGGDRRAADAFTRYLRDAGVSSIAYVIATHPHADHIAGLVNVLYEFEVGAVIMPRVAHTTVTFERLLDAIEEKNIPVIEPVPGATFRLGDAVLTIVAPNSGGHRNLNNYSVSALVTYGATSFLFTGDAEVESEDEMLANGLDLSAQVLHVGHHGSRTSTTEAFLQAVSPKIAVISVGASNSFGHPNAEVVQRLESSGARVYRTDMHGTIVIASDGSALTVR